MIVNYIFHIFDAYESINIESDAMGEDSIPMSYQRKAFSSFDPL